MKSLLHRVFQSLPEAELPVGLEERVLGRVASLRLREARRARVFSYARLVVSSGLVVGACMGVWPLIWQSEFIQLLSMFLSDASVLTREGGNIAWLFLETFPTLSVTVFLTPIFLLLVSVMLHVSSMGKYKFQTSFPGGV